MDKSSLIDQGIECLKTGKLEEAVQLLEKATKYFPGDYRAFNYLGITYAQMGHTNRSIGALQTALQLRSDIPSIHYNLGLAYKADGITEKAKEHFERALELNPKYDRAMKALESLFNLQMGNNTPDSCARHPDEQAVAICSFCRLPMCLRCRTKVSGMPCCSKCAEKMK